MRAGPLLPPRCRPRWPARRGAAASWPTAVCRTDPLPLARACSLPETTGTPPPPRCGATACVYAGQLWVVGGGSGRDLLRSGRDLRDVYALDLATLVWRRVPLPPGPRCAGKCHASALVGRRLLLFGGSMAACSQVAWLDLEELRWGAPARVAGQPPCDRMSASAVLARGGRELLVFGGYTFSWAEVGDLWRLRLLPE